MSKVHTCLTVESGETSMVSLLSVDLIFIFIFRLSSPAILLRVLLAFYKPFTILMRRPLTACTFRQHMYVHFDGTFDIKLLRPFTVLFTQPSLISHLGPCTSSTKWLSCLTSGSCYPKLQCDQSSPLAPSCSEVRSVMMYLQIVGTMYG